MRPCSKADRTGRASRRRWLPLLLLLLAAVAAYGSGLHRHLGLATLRAEQDVLQAFVADHPVLAPLTYVLAYAAAVAVSLPGAVFLTLAGGFLFGTWLGGLLTVAGATAGAVAVFLIARTALGSALQDRAGPWLQRMEAGFRADALSYLLVLRLVPLFPFWLVNLVPALLGVPLRTYTLATFLGIVPGSLVYASVGAGLGTVLDRGEEPDLGLILEPHVLLPLLGLAGLALLPALHRHWMARRAAAAQDG
ncbi:TVP38/TMEM64 family protein [Benzoatithermus flavus]|uniref:TVP38/TMEM64 family membrane protein n=1 Tax=Benzoatithermus flavus TaxID=3108223 RepID=A0ABU8XQW0_9PROT